MIAVVIVELLILALLLMVLLAVLAVGYLRSSRRTSTGRHLIAVAGVQLAEAIGLLGLATGHTLPLLVYVAVYGAIDLVVVGWLVLLWRARHMSEEMT